MTIVTRIVSSASRCQRVLFQPSRSYCAAAASAAKETPIHIPTPNESRTYAPKLVKIVDDISALSLLEVSELNKLLKEKLNIADVPMMAAMPSSVSGAPTEDGEEAKMVKSAYTVKLTGFDDTKKVALIKEVKTIVEGMNLVQAKKFVESVPQVLKSGITKEEAEAMKNALEALGATITLE